MRNYLLKKTLMTLTLGLVLVGTVGCGSNNNGSNNQAPAYYSNGGQCYNGGQVVTSSYCGTNPGAVGYGVVNGQCMYTATNQISSPTYCSLGTQASSVMNYPTGLYPSYGSSGVTAGLCYGVYYYYVYGYFQPVYCAGSPDNCAGYTLVNGYGAFQYCM